MNSSLVSGLITLSFAYLFPLWWLINPNTRESFLSGLTFNDKKLSFLAYGYFLFCHVVGFFQIYHMSK